MLVEAWELQDYLNLSQNKLNLRKGEDTLNEHQIIKEYFSDVGSTYFVEQGVRVPVGDDAAIISLPSGKESVLSVDTSISGVHFLENMEPSDIAYRSVSVALSDLAACGASPAWFSLAISMQEYDSKWLSDFKKGLEDISNEFKIPLIGYLQFKNLLMSILAAISVGVKIDNIINVDKKLKPVDGRLEHIGSQKNNSKIILDYAHTPHALEQALKTIKKHFNSILF